MGAGMYIGTFFIGNNWDYRLIFLLFTLPQLSDWATQRNPVTKRIAVFTLIVLFWSLWYLVIRILLIHTIFLWAYISSLLDETANWALFAALIFSFCFFAARLDFPGFPILIQKGAACPSRIYQEKPATRRLRQFMTAPIPNCSNG